MRTKHLIMGLLLAVVLVLALAGPAAAVEFKDIGDNPYEASINALAYRQIVSGYQEADQTWTFRPDQPLLRQQFAKMAVLTMGYVVTAANVSTFKDTPPIDPADPLYPGSYVAVAAANHIIEGYTQDNTFRFYNNVTRQQAITIVVRAAGTTLADPPAGYKGVLDYSDPDHGANIKKAEYNGLLAGIPNLATWNTNQNATRGEAAEVLAQLFYRTGKILTVTGPSGTQEFTLAQLKALASTEGHGGYKNSIGTIVGPKLYKGVAMQALMALVGGGTTVKVLAADGYEKSYKAAEVNGVTIMYNPQSGEEITTISGALTMILAYQVDGGPLASNDGALRIGFVSPASDQVTKSGAWVSQVVKITVE
jgi:hypothetical protein